MKQNGFLTAVKQVLHDDPTFTICYNIKTAYYDKAEDETPAANAAFAGDKRIGLNRLVATAAILASAAVMLRLTASRRKKKK